MKKFAVYTLSLVAALSVDTAVRESKYYKSYNKTLVAVIIVLVAITIISFITYLDPEDGDNIVDEELKKD